MKRNPYRGLSQTVVGCTVTINRWLIGTAAAICKDCGVKFKVDDESIDYERDTIDAVVLADDEESYMDAAYDLHRDLGVDLM